MKGCQLLPGAQQATEHSSRVRLPYVTVTHTHTHFSSSRFSKKMPLHVSIRHAIAFYRRSDKCGLWNCQNLRDLKKQHVSFLHFTATGRWSALKYWKEKNIWPVYSPVIQPPRQRCWSYHTPSRLITTLQRWGESAQHIRRAKWAKWIPIFKFWFASLEDGKLSPGGEVFIKPSRDLFTLMHIIKANSCISHMGLCVFHSV